MAKREARAADSHRRPIQDLREWLKRVEQLGELIRVTQPVSCEEEMSAIAYLVAKQQPSPAILFDKAKGYEKSPIGARLLWNILGPSLKRIALTLEEPTEISTVDLIRRAKEKLGQRTPPREVPQAQAGFYQNSLTGNKIDLTQLPIPKHWPLDGGHYAGTADAVITRDPDTGYINIGTYRMMLQGKNQVGLYLLRPLGALTPCSWSLARKLFPKTFRSMNMLAVSKANPSPWSKEKPPISYFQRTLSS
jgi:UbiD family decarboxylase